MLVGMLFCANDRVKVCLCVCVYVCVCLFMFVLDSILFLPNEMS